MHTHTLGVNICYINIKLSRALGDKDRGQPVETISCVRAVRLVWASLQCRNSSNSIYFKKMNSPKLESQLSQESQLLPCSLCTPYSDGTAHVQDDSAPGGQGSNYRPEGNKWQLLILAPALSSHPPCSQAEYQAGDEKARGVGRPD